LPVAGKADEESARLSAPLPASQGRPVLATRPDDAHALLLAAKALVFCGFPYKRTPHTTIVREARIGTDAHLTVHFSTTKLGVPIPFGADRALLAWITTLAYQTGWVSFDSLTSFFDLPPRPIRRRVPSLRGAARASLEPLSHPRPQDPGGWTA
jgi:hypothetical protein